MLFLETVSDDIGQNRFAIIQGTIKKDPHNQSIIYFTEISHQGHWFSRWFPGTYVVRRKPFSLEVLAAVKASTCGFNLKTLRLPRKIKEEIKKFQDLNELIKSFYAPPAPGPLSLYTLWLELELELPTVCLGILISISINMYLISILLP